MDRRRGKSMSKSIDVTRQTIVFGTSKARYRIIIGIIVKTTRKKRLFSYSMPILSCISCSFYGFISYSFNYCTDDAALEALKRFFVF